MGFLSNIKIFKDADGTYSLTAKFDDAIKFDAWDVSYYVKKAVINHFTKVSIEKLSEEMSNKFSTEEILKATREGFIEKVKEKFIKD